jgi:signal transduction histidine kinase
VARVLESDSRIRRLIIGTSWVSLVVGTLAGIVVSGSSLSALGAALISGVWVLAMSVVPIHVMIRPLVLDALALGGALLAVTSMTLTGGTSSPYIILSFMPIIAAGAWSGLRLGLATAGLTSGLLFAILVSEQPPDAPVVPPEAGVLVLYILVGVTVAQIRRLLTDAIDRAAQLESTTVEHSRRLEDLERANRLLAQLTELTATAETSPIELGRTALMSLQEQYPAAALTAAIVGEKGPIVVARVGQANGGSFEHRVDLVVGGREVGYVRINSPHPIDEAEAQRVTIGLEPLALAFSNALLLQDLTNNAVKEERTRLARELHDEIGPNLSALGLSLDVAMFQGAERRDLTDHLQQLRDQVGAIVEEVRTTVSDLRTPRLGSLVAHLTSVAALLGGEVDLQSLDERRPVRPSLADALYGVAGEALRNAIRHSGAVGITVKGWIDFDQGRVVIEDDGVGFDPDGRYEGHFGLIGMRERARAAGIDLSFSSGHSGTKVVLSWGPPS